MSASRISAQRSQRGQALVMTLLFGAVAGLAVLFMFNSSQLANTKSQLQNADDAGAYSAATLQARDHNFSAYTNRAIIANQVTQEGESTWYEGLQLLLVYVVIALTFGFA